MNEDFFGFKPVSKVYANEGSAHQFVEFSDLFQNVSGDQEPVHIHLIGFFDAARGKGHRVVVGRLGRAFPGVRNIGTYDPRSMLCQFYQVGQPAWGYPQTVVHEERSRGPDVSQAQIERFGHPRPMIGIDDLEILIFFSSFFELVADVTGGAALDDDQFERMGCFFIERVDTSGEHRILVKRYHQDGDGFLDF